MKSFEYWRNLLGIDRAIVYTAGAKLIQSLTSIASLLVIVRVLSPARQGYFYTFQSVLALQIFFELGMTTVLVQVTAHEAADLHIVPLDSWDLDATQVRRLASLFRFMLKWYGTAALSFFVIVLPIGIEFFRRSTNTANLSFAEWGKPWICVMLSTALSLVFQGIVSFVEGTGRIAQAARARGLQSLGSGVGLLASLTLGASLYAPALAQFCGLLAGASTLFATQGRLLAIMLRAALPETRIHWRASIWDFQWRIAVSFLSGYLIYQFATPMFFINLGPVAAGRYGMTMQVSTGAANLAMAWTATRQARWGAWIARGERLTLDSDYKQTLIRTVAVYVVIAAAFAIALAIAGAFGLPIAERFANWPTTGAVLLMGAVNQIVFTEAVYLRAHKKEPFLWPSLTGAVANGLGAIALSHFGTFPVAACYLVGTVTIGLIWGTVIFYRFRKAVEAEATGRAGLQAIQKPVGCF